MSLKFHARTDVGLKRKQNEDSLLAAEEFGVFVVADGVGGRKAGELASAITVNTFQAYAPTLKASVDAYATAPGRETRLAVLALLDQACNAASRRVYESAASTGRQGMTTTLVAAVVGGGSAFLCHVGDSRIYLLRDNGLKQITEDHSMINELIRTGTLTAEEANNTRYRNVITRAIGLYPTVRPDTMHLELLDGDRLLLCSDGLSDMIEDEDMARLLGMPKVPAAVDALLQAALDGGGRDNVTVVALEPEALLQAETVAARARAMENLFLFGDLPDHARLRVGRIVSERFVAPDEVVVRQGEPGDTLFVIVQGQFAVRINGKEVAIAEAGEHFGELALVDEEPRSADIVAKGFGHLIGIDRAALQEFCVMEPALGNALLWRLLATLGQRLRSANVRLAATPR